MIISENFKKWLLEVYPEYSYVSGPNRRKDGRLMILLYTRYMTKQTNITYARALMQAYIGKRLDRNIEVDHINNNPFDDRMENYQLLTRSENAKKSSGNLGSKTYICPVCSIEFIKSISDVTKKSNQSKAGPFCSRNCAGKFNRQKVLNRK